MFAFFPQAGGLHQLYVVGSKRGAVSAREDVATRPELGPFSHETHHIRLSLE